MQGTIELSISSLHCINDPLNHNRKFQNSKHCFTPEYLLSEAQRQQ